MRKFWIKFAIASTVVGIIVLVASRHKMPVITIYNLF